MAKRPVYSTIPEQPYFVREETEFEFFNGFSDMQKKKSIQSLHQAYLQSHPGRKILEISTKSEEEIGIQLSAFNLSIRTRGGNVYSVESIFQSSKVFENGGPYKDLLNVSSREAKKDARLRNSGEIIAFTVNGLIFPTKPRTYFYNWLYMNALFLHGDLTEKLVEYDAFTDISFNPQKSLNCQAQAAAVYVSLYQNGLLQKAMNNKEDFLKIVYAAEKEKEEEHYIGEQMSLFDFIK